MLEENDYKTTDLLSPFFREVVGVCCGSLQAAPVADVFTEYVDTIRGTRNED